MTPVARNEAEMMERALETLGRDDIKVNSLALARDKTGRDRK